MRLKGEEESGERSETLEHCVITWTVFRIGSAQTNGQSLPYSLVERMANVQHSLIITLIIV